jgi:hypothetical protein
MPCPTCNATLQNLGLDQPGRRTFWCPNCGTLKWERGDPAGDVFVEIDVPKGTKLFVAGGTESDEFVRWQREFNDRVSRALLEAK